MTETAEAPVTKYSETAIKAALGIVLGKSLTKEKLDANNKGSATFHITSTSCPSKTGNWSIVVDRFDPYQIKSIFYSNPQPGQITDNNNSYYFSVEKSGEIPKNIVTVIGQDLPALFEWVKSHSPEFAKMDVSFKDLFNL